jgi:hypothetical protein
MLGLVRILGTYDSSKTRDLEKGEVAAKLSNGGGYGPPHLEAVEPWERGDCADQVRLGEADAGEEGTYDVRRLTWCRYFVALRACANVRPQAAMTGAEVVL